MIPEWELPVTERLERGYCARCVKSIPEYPMTTHKCCICADSRFVRGEYPLGDEKFGKRIPCPVCVVGAGDNEEMFVTRSCIPSGYLHCRTSNLDGGGLRKAIGEYVDTWPPSLPFLVLVGTRGTGKTHMECAVLREVWERRKLVGRFVEVIDLLHRYKATFGKDATETVASIESGYRNSPLLVLDDLGAEKSTEWSQEQLYDLINHRYSRRMPLIVSSNVAFDQMEPRIASRLQDTRMARLIQFTGRDRRVNP